VYRFVFSWRWIRLHVLVWLVLIPAFIGLGLWQQSRYHERSAQNVVLRAAMHGAPVPLDTIDAVGATVPKSNRWKQVIATGVYDTGHQFLARNHQQNGNPGFYVITPLVAADGTAVLVNRGWIPADGANAQATPPIPAAPTGPVTVTARLQMTETKASTGIKDVTAGLPAGQISLVNTEALTATTGLKLRGGYVERISSSPADAASISLLGEPSLDEGPYLAYWFQWWLFAAIAVGAWVVIIRREAQHRVAEAEAAEEEVEEEEEADLVGESASEPAGETAGQAAGDAAEGIEPVASGDRS
jgi:cytochrome oxidase assembly protein ShyY1